MMRTFVLAFTIGLPPLAAMAQDVALLIGNERYSSLERIVQATEVVDATRVLTAQGFAVRAMSNGTWDQTADVLAQFAEDADAADRMIVALSGRFAHDAEGRSWFLTTEARDPTLLDVGQVSVSVDSLMAIMAQVPGQAVLLLATDLNDNQTYDPFLRGGIGALNVPQGVTVVIGEPRQAGDILADTLAMPGQDLIAAVANSRRMTISGYAPDAFVMLDRSALPPVTNTIATDAAAEAALWAGAQALDTETAYRNYLQRYPQGQYAADAERLIAEIASEPNRGARLAEESLALSRDARRAVQRALTILNFNPRGIDGIFGPGTRSAVANWQQQSGFSQTGYLNAEQINRLDAQAARRAAELEAEAERKRVEELRLDRAYWEETGARGDEPGYRAYLDRYPDGAFAQQATDALEAIAARNRDIAAAEDRALWDRAAAENTQASYRTYLQVYPAGAFKAEAEARLAALSQPARDDNAAAESAESALGLNALTTRMVEARLSQLGLEPGEVDGRFDDKTRRAIRRYQRDRSLDISGFLNEQTIVRLLADGFIVGR